MKRAFPALLLVATLSGCATSWVVDSDVKSFSAIDTVPAGATYRYLICLHRHGNRLSCWRRYPEALGWQRRCGPMPVAQFIHRFNQHLISPP